MQRARRRRYGADEGVGEISLAGLWWSGVLQPGAVESRKPQGRARRSREVKEREQQGGGGEKKIKNGTLEIWNRARKNRVQNTRELTVNLQSPGREREKKRGEKNGKNVFVEKKQTIEKRVDGGVEHVASSWLLGFLLFLLQQS